VLGWRGRSPRTHRPRRSGHVGPNALLQPLPERLRSETGTDIVVIMTTDGIRFTHPNPGQITGRFRGTIAPAARGEPLTETFTGTSRPSVRAVVPVVDGGDVRGLLAVGRTVERVSRGDEPSSSRSCSAPPRPP
jgi:two-component system CitB family sensor kinase